MKRFFVLVSNDIGGAEKRFYDIFKLCYSFNSEFYLVLPKRLSMKLNVDSCNKNIIALGSGNENLREYVHLYKKWLSNINEEAYFHYPMNCLFFMHFFKKHHISMSLTNCYYTPTLLTLKKSLLRQYITLLYVNKVDVLSPSIFNNLYKTFLNRKLSLTPSGTFVDPKDFYILKKRNNIGFIGRFIEGKGLKTFFDIVERTWPLIKDKVTSDFSYEIAGYGKLQPFVENKVEILRKQSIPINFIGYQQSNSFLAETNIVLSLQEITNYPSRVVAESLLSGCNIIILNTGDSRKFGENIEGISYIDTDYNVSNLANLFINILKCNDYVELEKNRQSAIKKFSNDKVYDYYLRIMS